MDKKHGYQSPAQNTEQLAPPSKCAESELTRLDGGVKSPEVAASVMSGAHDPVNADFVGDCSLNQTKSKAAHSIHEGNSHK